MLGGLRIFQPGKLALIAGAIVLGGAGVAAAAPACHGGSGGPVVVTSVNGVSTAGTCGVSGATGTFTVVGPKLQIETVDVGSSTTFTDSADPSPSFLDVCVASHVTVTGTSSSGTETASNVTVVQVATRLKGVVTSVNGTPTAGTCGTAGTAGVFTMVGKKLHIHAVDVSTTTTFTDVADPTPSFADICVGNIVLASGTIASGVVTATAVVVLPPNLARVRGVVTSVNGTSTAGTCGTAATAGTFTLVGNWRHGIISGAVSTTTTFTDAADSSPSFADVCVGTDVTAFGTYSSGTLTAAKVAVLPTTTAGTNGGSGGGSGGGRKHHGHGGGKGGKGHNGHHHG